ncbi:MULTISPECIES: MerR family transcriptional regulator [unclassified Novosphingobium]|uniref:MerR family transcriptional regulator n=1 Tax=unclassified Novosphingobium TaxID=2644732 RepID=UPI0025E22D38|nr:MULTISPECIES: MerR family transcriptional regulator [unclassified Novosphingobium]HQV04490.1 MerR family transcriptional regulator [Novosphingobium sp.]
MANFKIGELAAAAGVGRDTIRYYERLGLLQAAARNAAGYRIYGIDTLERLQFIRSVQELGFSLEQTRELIEASNLKPTRLIALLGIVRSKLDTAKSNIDRLLQVERVLANLSKKPAASSPLPLWTCLRDENFGERAV